jgi:hypothetical protein
MILLQFGDTAGAALGKTADENRVAANPDACTGHNIV